MFELTDSLINDLQQFDTPTVCNALEIVAPKRRGYGFTTKPLVCTRPELPPIVGIARTATIRAAHPSDLRGEQARALSDGYYAYIDEGRKPSIVVIQDLDDERGYGSWWGEVIPDIAEGFQMMADRVGPSHAYVHVVDYSRPVTVAGMRVAHDDLIHCDQHGAVVIPHDVADKIKPAAEEIARRERVIISAAQTPGFDIEKLREAQGEAAEIH